MHIRCAEKVFHGGCNPVSPLERSLCQHMLGELRSVREDHRMKGY